MRLPRPSILTRALKRVAHMDAAEFLFRSRERVRTVLEAATHSGTVGWKPEGLRSRLLPASRELVEVQHALDRGDRFAAATALRSHLVNRAPLFPIHPRSRPSIAASILE